MIEYCISGCKAGLFDCVYFLDSAISADVLKRFCNEIIASGAKFSWGTNSRFDDVFANDEFIKLMADAGCVFIKFGLESGSQRVLDMMNKGTKIDNASIIINLCRTHGIFVHTYVMFAYPGETEDDRKITQEFLLSDYSHPDNYNCSEFILYGTAPIAKELNYSFESDFSKEGWHSSSYSFSNSNIKSSISKMRELFTQKYQPASVLASTGHTIALAKQLTKNPARSPIVREDSVLLLSNTAISIELAGKAFLGKWRRHDGFIYFSGDWASTVRNLFINITTRDALNNGISLATIFDLIAENFITITQEGVGNAVQSIGESEIIFQYGHSFDTMKWYGYSDLD